jgi:hypothetical protein
MLLVGQGFLDCRAHELAALVSRSAANFSTTRIAFSRAAGMSPLALTA